MATLFIALVGCESSAPVGPVLNAEQMTKLFTGATMKGKSTRTGNPFVIKFNADGTYAGDAGGRSLKGTWRISKAGKMCDTGTGCKQAQHVSGKKYKLFFASGRVQEVTISN